MNAVTLNGELRIVAVFLAVLFVLMVGVVIEFLWRNRRRGR